MIGTIRKHQTWLWFIIIIAIVISFVWFFSPSAKMHNDEGPKADLGSINGEAITPRQFNEARNEAALGLFLKYHEWPKQDERLREMLEGSAYQSILINAKLKELHVEVTPEATARRVKQMFGLEPNQAMPMEEFQKFVQRELLPNKLTEEDFERFVAHQVGQEHLIALFGMSGKLITPKEAESFYRRENEPVVAQAAIFSLTNYLSQITVTPKVIEEYYTNNQADYRLPPRVEVKYVKFDITNFLAEVDKEMASNTNLTEQIESIYAQQGAEAFKDKAGKPLPKTEALVDIKKRMREATAQTKAKKAAYAFLTDLDQAYSDTKPYKPEDFETFAKSKGLSVKSTEAFDQQNGPRGIKSQEFVQRAFRLGDDPSDPSKKSFFSASPIVTDEAIYCISYKQSFPSQMQSLETVRAEVTKAYTRSQATERAMAAGSAFANAVTNGLAAGKSFDAICKAEKVKATTLTPFSLMARSIPEVDSSDFERIQRVASTLPAHASSPFIPGEFGGCVLYVDKRLEVDTAKMKTELPAFIARLRDMRQSAAFGEWFQKAAKEMNLVTPARSRM